MEFADPMFGQYDRVYMSKVFTFTPDYPYGFPCEVIKGGTGYRDYATVLPPEVEHTCPDYGLYNYPAAIGFLTRGCVNRCPWCVVPRKEGALRGNADIEEFLDGRRNAVLLDNNVLASGWGLEQIEKIIRLGVRVDFNQGLDARQIARNPPIAELLSRVKWMRYIRMAYDSTAVRDDVRKAIERLKKCGMKPAKMFFYVLVREVDDALARIEELDALGCQPFAQPYRDFENKIRPTPEQRRLARWCNHKPTFHTVNYKNHKE